MPKIGALESAEFSALGNALRTLEFPHLDCVTRVFCYEKIIFFRGVHSFLSFNFLTNEKTAALIGIFGFPAKFRIRQYHSQGDWMSGWRANKEKRIFKKAAAPTAEVYLVKTVKIQRWTPLKAISGRTNEKTG